MLLDGRLILVQGAIWHVIGTCACKYAWRQVMVAHDITYLFVAVQPKQQPHPVLQGLLIQGHRFSSLLRTLAVLADHFRAPI
jgi:hypothetical protein